MTQHAKKEFEAEMLRLYPNLYKDMYGDMRETCMAWGIEVGPGWWDIIRDLSAKLEAEILKQPEEERQYYKATQIKEKFGGLRWYMSSSTDEMNKLISAAEDQSYKTCEECGQAGEAKGPGWILTLCDVCRKAREDQRKKQKEN